MTIRERIEEMIKKAKDRDDCSLISESYWNGYVAFGQELLLHVKLKDKE